jgi:hypothetical protein
MPELRFDGRWKRVQTLEEMMIFKNIKTGELYEANNRLHLRRKYGLTKTRVSSLIENIGSYSRLGENIIRRNTNDR